MQNSTLQENESLLADYIFAECQNSEYLPKSQFFMHQR
jgi:hypothetical protein